MLCFVIFLMSFYYGSTNIEVKFKTCTWSVMNTLHRHFCLRKASNSYGIKIAPFSSLLVIQQVKQNSSLLGVTARACILNWRHLLTVMSLDCYSTLFSNPLRHVEEWLRGRKPTWFVYFWQQNLLMASIFWCGLTDECAVFVQNLFCFQILTLCHENWRQTVQRLC